MRGSTASVLQYLSDINRDLGITTVIVTHEMNVIRAIADNVAVMEDGRIVEQFDLAELQRPDFSPSTAIGRYLISDDIQLDRPDQQRAHRAGEPTRDAAAQDVFATASRKEAAHV